MPKHFVLLVSCLSILGLHIVAVAQTPPTQELRLLQFGSDQCPVCRQIQPVIDRCIERGYPIQYINVATQRQLAEKYQIKELPTFVLVFGDRELERFVGEADQRILSQAITGIFDRGQERLLQQRTSVIPEHQNTLLQDRNSLQQGTLRSQKSYSDLTSQPIHPNNSTLPATPNLPASPNSVTQTSAVVPANSSFSQQIQPQHLQSQQTSLTQQPPFPVKNGPAAWVESTVRLRIEDANRVNWGTGTIIDTRCEQALILTCGHIFRDSNGEGLIEVHLFNGQDATPIKVLGKLEHWDLATDLGFVKIFPPCPVRVTPLAPVDTLQIGQKVFSVGCNGGANPTLMEHQILSLARLGVNSPFYYIQVSGTPTQGRSGGGLFSENGYVVGVCTLGDPARNDGQFIPLTEVRRLLDAMSLDYVYKSPSLIDNSTAMVAHNREISPQLNDFQSISGQSAGTIPLERLTLTGEKLNGPLISDEEVATLEEIQKRRSKGAEIIVIINSPRQGNRTPQSEIVRLTAVSDQFLDQLLGQTAESQHRSLLTEQAAKNLPAGMQQNFLHDDSQQREMGAREIRQ